MHASSGERGGDGQGGCSHVSSGERDGRQEEGGIHASSGERSGKGGGGSVHASSRERGGTNSQRAGSWLSIPGIGGTTVRHGEQEEKKQGQVDCC